MRSNSRKRYQEVCHGVEKVTWLNKIEKPMNFKVRKALPKTLLIDSRDSAHMIYDQDLFSSMKACIFGQGQW